MIRSLVLSLALFSSALAVSAAPVAPGGSGFDWPAFCDSDHDGDFDVSDYTALRGAGYSVLAMRTCVVVMGWTR